MQSGDVLRAVERFPKQGAKAPWRMAQNYCIDLLNMRLRPVAGRNLAFAR